MGMFWNFENDTKLSRSTAYLEKVPPMGGKKIDLRVDSCCHNLCNENQAASEGKEREAERCREREREINTSGTKKGEGGARTIGKHRNDPSDMIHRARAMINTVQARAHHHTSH